MNNLYIKARGFGKIQTIINDFKARAVEFLSIFESESCLNTTLTNLENQNILSKFSVILTPNAYKASKLLSVVPKFGSADFDVTRATSATRINSSGVVENIGLNVPRIDYTGGGCPSILLEPQRTNLYLNSETLVTQNITTIATSYTISFYGTGTITFSGTFSGTLVGTGTSNRVTLTFTTTSGTLTSTVSGTVTKAQSTIGLYATSYIPALSSAVTRNSDIIIKNGISDFIGQAQGALFIEASSFDFNGSGFGERISLTDGSFNNRIGIDFNSNGNVTLVISSPSSTGTISSASNVVLKNTIFKIAVVYNGVNSFLAINGVIYNTITGTIPTFSGQLNTIEFNQGNNSRPFYGNVKVLGGSKLILTQSEVIQLTTL